MASVAVLLDDDFEDSEYLEPIKALKEAGHETTIVGLKEGREVIGKVEGTKVVVEKGVSSVDFDAFDALLIPGGYSPDRLRASRDAVSFVKQFLDEQKPLFAICHGPQLLITARGLEGRRATGYVSIAQDIKNAGAEYLDEEVVVDGNLVTSRTPSDLPAFCKEMLKLLAP